MKLLTFRIYGENGHEQKASFGKSEFWDFSFWDTKNDEEIIRKICIDREDKTNTNGYADIIIERNSVEECLSEFFDQLSDGIFKNTRFGEIKVFDGEVIYKIVNVDGDNKLEKVGELESSGEKLTRMIWAKIAFDDWKYDWIGDHDEEPEVGDDYELTIDGHYMVTVRFPDDERLYSLVDYEGDARVVQG